MGGPCVRGRIPVPRPRAPPERRGSAPRRTTGAHRTHDGPHAHGGARAHPDHLPNECGRPAGPLRGGWKGEGSGGGFCFLGRGGYTAWVGFVVRVMAAG